MSEIAPESPPTPQARERVGFFDDFRRFFMRGLATLLPTLITLLLLFKAWEILWDYLGKHIIAAIRLVHGYLVPESDVGRVKWYWDIKLKGSWQEEVLGVILAIILVYIVGLFVGNLLGRTAWRIMEVGVMRIPLIRAIYPAVKQVTDFVLAERKSHVRVNRVVAVQARHTDIWSIGLVTGQGLRSLSNAAGNDMLTVFIPSSPTAFSGYVVVVPRDRVIELPLSVEEAMRLLLTGGVINPTEDLKHQQDAAAAGTTVGPLPAAVPPPASVIPSPPPLGRASGPA